MRGSVLHACARDRFESACLWAGASWGGVVWPALDLMWLWDREGVPTKLRAVAASMPPVHPRFMIHDVSSCSASTHAHFFKVSHAPSATSYLLSPISSLFRVQCRCIRTISKAMLRCNGVPCNVVLQCCPLQTNVAPGANYNPSFLSTNNFSYPAHEPSALRSSNFGAKGVFVFMSYGATRLVFLPCLRYEATSIGVKTESFGKTYEASGQQPWTKHGVVGATVG